MNRKLILTVLSFAALLCGCGQGQKQENDVVVYRLDSSEGEPTCVFSTELIRVEEDDAVQTAMDALNSPSAAGARRAFPEGVDILSARYEKGKVTLDMSASYAKLGAAEKALADIAAAMTFAGIDRVCYVDIYCAGTLCAQNLSLWSADFEDSSMKDASKAVKIFLPGEFGLDCETVMMELPRGADILETLVAEVIARLSDGGSGFGVSPQTRVLSVTVEDYHCSVDLSEEFFATEPQDFELAEQIIYSFVNTLCLLPGIDTVSISVDGRAISSYGSYGTVWSMAFSYELSNF